MKRISLKYTGLDECNSIRTPTGHKESNYLWQRTNSIKIIAVCVLIAFFTINGYCQLIKPPNEDGKKDVKVVKREVPKEVTESYNKVYPDATFEAWYCYPPYDFKNEWFDDWYDYGPYAHIKIPEYYVVEFTNENTPHKAIYSKAGKKVATHKALTSELPKAVSEAISKGEYKTWELGKEKEEIFKDSEKDQIKVYKVTVENEKEKHALFFQADGTLLKDKKVS